MNIWKISKKAKDGELQERDVYFLIGRGRKITNTFNFDLYAKHLEFIIFQIYINPFLIFMNIFLIFINDCIYRY